jgi:hypothetical protein
VQALPPGAARGDSRAEQRRLGRRRLTRASGCPARALECPGTRAVHVRSVGQVCQPLRAAAPVRLAVSARTPNLPRRGTSPPVARRFLLGKSGRLRASLSHRENVCLFAGFFSRVPAYGRSWRSRRKGARASFFEQRGTAWSSSSRGLARVGFKRRDNNAGVGGRSYVSPPIYTG